MAVFLSLKSGWELHCIMLVPTGVPQASALWSRGLGEVDIELYLVQTSWLPELRPYASFSGALLVHFHVQVLLGGSWGHSPQVKGDW